MNKYKELRNRQQEEVNKFPMKFAFSDEQFKEGMKALGLTENDTDKVYSIRGGGFIRKTDSEAFGELFKKHNKEMEEAIAADLTGDDFIYHMFYYELNNYEYGYTGELDDTLEALDLTMEDINKDERLLHGLNKAIEKINECEF